MSPVNQWRPATVADAFPSLRAALAQPESRRSVLRLMAASLALAGCDPSTPDGSYTPAVTQAPGIVPGLPNRYATVLDGPGGPTGAVVTHDMGRPVGLAGNPAHPASLGALGIHGQAALLDFYDPDRATGLRHHGQVATEQALAQDLLRIRALLAADGGKGLRLLTRRVASPSLQAAIAALLARYPAAQWVQWEAVDDTAPFRATALAYGRPLALLPRPGNADVLLALDSDLLDSAPGHLAHARAFAGRRNPVNGPMSRVYAAEPLPTLLGGVADHRFRAAPGELVAAINALWAALDGPAPADAPGWVAPVAADLRAAGRRALVHAGPHLPAEALALVHAINERLGGRGVTFDLIEPTITDPAEDRMAALLDDMHAGRVQALAVLDANPAYGARGFADALRAVGWSLHAAPAPDETARLASWHVPATHAFEAWGDARAFDGSVAVQQPQALPLYGGRSAFAVLAMLAGPDPAPDSQAVVRHSWAALDDDAWADALADGVVPGTAHPPAAAALRPPTPAPVPPPQTLTALLRPDPNLWDGRWANNAWLQELPRPVGKLVWDNPLLVPPALAAARGLADGDVVRLELGGAAVELPVWSVPGQAEGCVVAWLGGGRQAAGRVGNGVGTDVTALQGRGGIPTLHRTGRRVELATTDHHNVLDVPPDMTDPVVRHTTLAAFTADAHALDRPAPLRLYERPPGAAVAWGMSIDLNACIGCNACVVACQAENNVPVVGREQVRLGREMHWLRIDRYYEGPAEDPQSLLQPMLCMHCESAPCEPVCPVEASIHDSEGLNVQVYNRCIGTRFCSNNCPYKVRRFNFGAWAAEEHRPPAARNPDVSVRSRGVMEKCTFCVQRIAAARIAHDRDGTPEEAVTACQAACPTQAFTFGDTARPGSDVARRKASPLSYALLEEQNTRPRVTYEARVRNPNPALPA